MPTNLEDLSRQDEVPGLARFLTAQGAVQDALLRRQQLEQQQQFLREKAALGTNPSIEDLQNVGVRNINEPKSLVDIVGKMRELIPLGAGGLYNRRTNEVISPAEKPPAPTQFGDVHNVPGGYIKKKPEGGYEFVQTQQDKAEPAPSLHPVQDAASPTGWSWHDFRIGARVPGAPPPRDLNLSGGRESVYINRMILGANQASKDLANVVQLPLSASTGVFGGRRQGPGILDATSEVLANKATTQETQAYNAMATGFQRSLAQIEAAGLMPSGNLTHQMDAVLFKEGDTNLTKLHKLAQTRQIIEAASEVVNDNPRVPDELKSRIKQILESVKKSVPFTHSDLINLQKLQQTNPNATLKDVIGKPSGATGGWSIRPK